ncbi:MAG TPA: chromate resistance protein [Magnetococcales bacterium]|nr:chromate resistance protein [Magnetococcales bacterium]
MNALRWSLLIHNIPPKPAYLRNKVSNRLAALGAVALKNSVYLLPDSASAKEDFVWLAQEIETGGGRAFVGEVVFYGKDVDEGIKGAFMSARNQEYGPLLAEADTLLTRMESSENTKNSDNEHEESYRHRIDTLRKRAHGIRRIDFFRASGGEAMEGKLSALENQLKRLTGQSDPEVIGKLLHAEEYHGKVWVTRSGVFVDRMASAWLIRRFVDPEAKFCFVDDWNYQPALGEIRFDMPGGEFTHEGDECTFEVLVRRFGLASEPMKNMAGIIHDIDVKSDSCLYPESTGVGSILSGVVMTTRDDHERLQRGWQVMEDLFNGLLARAGKD